MVLLGLTPESLPPYRMGDCEEAARSRGLLQSHSAVAPTSEDFEDSPNIGTKSLSEKDWAKLLLSSDANDIANDMDLHQFNAALHPEVLLTLENTSANQSAAAVEGATQSRLKDLKESFWILLDGLLLLGGWR